MSRCFQIDELKHLVSDATFKQLAGRAEILILKGGQVEARWKNLIPDIVPIDKRGAMNDLIILHLKSGPNIECLIETGNDYYDIYIGVLCQLAFRAIGDYDVGEVHPPLQLQKLVIENCEALEYIITNSSSGGEAVNDDGENDQRSFDSLFPELKALKISGVPSLMGIFRDDDHMSSSLQNPSPTLSTNNSKKMIRKPTIRAFSWVQAWGFQNNLQAISEEANFANSNKRLVPHTISQELLDASTDGVSPFHAAQSLLVTSLKNVREIELVECWNLILLSTLSIAASTISLENLTVRECHKLKCITTHEGDDQVGKTYCSIFQRLENLHIEDCKELEFLLLSEQNPSYQNQNDELQFNLPALEILHIEDAPEFNSICAKNYKLVLSSLQKLYLKKCSIKSLIGFTGCSDDEEQMNWKTTKELHAPTDKDLPFNASQSLLVQSLKNVKEIELVECWNLISLSTLSTAASTISLENLTIRECHKLKCITTHEEDAQVDKNYCSIFPRLDSLKIEDCKELEFLFLSKITGGLENLKSLMIKKVPKLRCVVGNYSQEQQASYDLPALETLSIEDAPKMNSICAENSKLEMSSLQKLVLKKCSIKSLTDSMGCSDEEEINWTTTKELLDASTDRVRPFHAAQSLLDKSLKNVREIELEECWNLISLSTLSIAASKISLENLTISRCHQLKCITTHEGDDQVGKTYCSFFPRLENLHIEDCKELEFLFLSVISCGIEKLKSLSINEVPELKYVVGMYHEEQHSPYQNQDDELHFDLPALETLSIEYASKFNDIFANNYNLVNWRTTQEFHESTDGAPVFHVAESLMMQSLKNIREMKLVNCENLISVSTLSIASTVMLEDLTIKSCYQLKCIVADEGDSGTHMNNNSNFAKLKHLEVSYCNALEYLFPSYAFRSPSHLESLKIYWASMLKYVFGRSQHEDNLTHENHKIQTGINFPALEYLSIQEVPQLVIEMHDHTLESLMIWDCKVEEMFCLRNMDIEKKREVLEPLTSSLQLLHLNDLSELVNLCVGAKRIISFHSLQDLRITACKKFKVIFSASTVKSLPMLMKLHISECEELVHIVEEDYETNADDHLNHEQCFPSLKEVIIGRCDKLKYLFSITISDILPNLSYLNIRGAYELEHVLIRRGVMKEMVMKDVLPRLNDIRLYELPKLISLCHGIDFQILKRYQLNIDPESPHFSLYGMHPQK
ncbi:uncharacterized protein LOC129314062 [Prosopis cineraria]|uniref:uncharacterized protein LOC129314062 n=1 Tax=Prosopis cineraria TaxID=364024 RepID=UPI0024101C57|nr:uncharacterized protein LOC129314062 [Prosopis cineraria]